MSGSARGRMRLAVPIAVIAALGLAAAPVQAAKGGGKPAIKLKTATATATVVGTPALDVATATATCPGKTKAVSGGYTTTAPALPPAAGAHWLNVHESQKVGQNQWRVSGAEFFDGGTDTLTAYVYCETFKTKLKTASAVTPISTTLNATSTAFATCPKGTRALSGGFATPASDGVAFSSYVSRSIAGNATGWVVDATRLAGVLTGNVTAIGYCAAVAKIKGRSGTAAVTGPANTAKTATTQKCQKGLLARGGGFATSTPVGGLTATALVYETKNAGKSWTSSASASGNTTSSTLQTNAYCR